MKYVSVSCLFLFLVLKGLGQTPSNDPTWQLNWGDEFNYTGTPDVTKWHLSYPWAPSLDSTRILTTDDGHNAKVLNDSFLSLTMKRGSYNAHMSFDYYHTWRWIRRPYTDGEVSTLRKFHYGYLEARVRMPDSDNPALFGNYINNAFWGFGRDSILDVDWDDVDFEICTGDYGTPFHNAMECNSQVETPWNSGKKWDSIHPGAPPGDYNDPAHFAFVKVNGEDSPYTTYKNRFFSRSLVFNHGWHTLGYEWLPDQIKMYLDNKLWVRVEGNIPFYSTDVYGNPQTFYPEHKLISDMWMIFGGGPSFAELAAADSNAGGPDSLSYDIDYFRYYTLTENCAVADTVSGLPVSYEMVGNYTQQVYDSVRLGKTGCGCGSPTPSKGVKIANGRVTIRAKNILFLDGFRTEENGELYAHDVDSCP